MTRAGALAVMLKRPEKRELFLPDDMPSHIDVSIDLARDNIFTESSHALDCLFNGGNRILYIAAPTRIVGAEAIDVIVNEKQIHRQLLSYARRALWLALGISLATAILVFASLYMFLVRPMAGITGAMITFSDNPEDASRILDASTRRDEIGTAERALAAMQRDLYGSLQQKNPAGGIGRRCCQDPARSAQHPLQRAARVGSPRQARRSGGAAAGAAHRHLARPRRGAGHQHAALRTRRRASAARHGASRSRR